MAAIELGEREEALVAQPGQDPALRDLHRDLNFGLVLWASRPRRQDGGAVMAGHLGIGAVEAGIVAIGVGHGRLEIVADHELRHAAQITRTELVCTPIQSGRLSLGQASA